MATPEEIASAGTYLSQNAGVEVTDGTQVRVTLGIISSTTGGDGATNPIDYGLKVVSSDGVTVIIDGTSDIFKISASGTLTSPSFAIPATVKGASSTANVIISTGFTSVPVYLGFRKQVGPPLLGFATLYQVVDFTSGSVLDGEDLWAGVINTNQTQVTVTTSTSRIGGGTFPSMIYGYYLLQEVAF